MTLNAYVRTLLDLLIACAVSSSGDFLVFSFLLSYSEFFELKCMLVQDYNFFLWCIINRKYLTFDTKDGKLMILLICK